MNDKRLYLIPTLLGHYAPDKVLPNGTLEVIRSLDFFIAEELKPARRFLSSVRQGLTSNEAEIILLNEHSQEEDIHEIMTHLNAGRYAGLISEAGSPCIADPGSEIVRQAHLAGIRVIPLTGPSSILLALMSSGFNGQSFAFHGYLPVDRSARIKKIKEIERRIYETDQTQIFIETPYRNRSLLQDLLSVCKERTLLSISIDLSTEDESVLTRSINEWRSAMPDIHKRPAVFLLYR